MAAVNHEEWTEAAAVDRWLDDLEAAETAAVLVRERLASPLVDGRAREHAYRDAAGRWLDRGQPLVALALLDWSTAAPIASTSFDGDPRSEVPVDLLMARLPGIGGLPALTEDEADALKGATTPEDALAVIKAARRRLEAHGEEARLLLKRWLDR